MLVKLMKKSLGFVLILMIIAFIVPMVSSSIVFKQPNPVYNIGDELNTKVDVSSLQENNEFLVADLICGAKTNELLRVPIKLKAGEQKSQEIIIDLDRKVLDGLSGVCFLRANYGVESVESRKFEISSEVNLNVESYSSKVNPGESLAVSGKAIKKNGELLSGVISLNVEGLNIYQTVSAVSGIFSVNFSIPKNAKSVEYNVEVMAYDKDGNGEIMNSGNSNFSFKVNPVLTKMDIALSELNVVPGNSITYTAFALDQAGDSMTSDATLTIVSPIGSQEERLIQTSQTYQIITKANSTSGTWKLIISSNNVSSEKSYQVEEYEVAEFKVLGNILTVNNIGNVVYDKAIEVTIGQEKIVVNGTYVPIGGAKNYELEAPDGDYDIFANDGSVSGNLGRSFLTGEVIAINDPNNKRFVNLTSGIWILIILVLGGVAFVYYKKVAKKSYYGATPSRRVSILAATPRADEVQNGEKENASLVALKLKNYDVLKGNDGVKGVVNGIVSDARRSGAYVEQGIGGALLFIFTKSVTKQADNTLSAVEFGKSMVEKIVDYNSKVTNRIEFGAGVNNGEIIAEYRGGILKYHAMGNSVFGAGKIADSASDALIISDSVHAITRARVKVEKAMNGWKVANIKDNSKYSDFIGKFMTRQKSGRDLV